MQANIFILRIFLWHDALRKSNFVTCKKPSTCAKEVDPLLIVLPLYRGYHNQDLDTEITPVSFTEKMLGGFLTVDTKTATPLCHHIEPFTDTFFASVMTRVTVECFGIYSHVTSCVTCISMYNPQRQTKRLGTTSAPKSYTFSIVKMS